MLSDLIPCGTDQRHKSYQLIKFIDSNSENPITNLIFAFNNVAGAVTKVNLTQLQGIVWTDVSWIPENRSV